MARLPGYCALMIYNKFGVLAGYPWSPRSRKLSVSLLIGINMYRYRLIYVSQLKAFVGFMFKTFLLSHMEKLYI